MNVTDRDFDVVVVGAGPAGSVAAIELCRVGKSVCLVDKARFPRDKCCGDGLTTGALRDLESLGLDPRRVASWNRIDALSVRSPSGRIVHIPLGDGTGCFGAVARRIDLDAALAQLAVDAGATLLQDAAVEGAERAHEESIDVVLSDASRLSARYLIAADGAWSPVKKALQDHLDDASQGGGADAPGQWFAFRTYASDVSDEAAQNLWVWFEPTVLPGYIWSFPLADHSVNLGVCTMRSPNERGATLRAKWTEVLQEPFVQSLLGPKAHLEGPVRSWPIPAGIDQTSLSAHEGRVLFVGDAARAADPMTGEGIAQAIQSAKAAAKAIAEHGSSSPQRVRDAYRTTINQTLRIDHRIGRWFSKLLSTPFGAESAVRIASANRFLSRNAGRWLYEDYPKALAFSPSNWPAIARHEPGPYAQETNGR